VLGRALIRGASLNGFVALATGLGLDANALIAAAKLSKRALYEPDLRIPVSAFAILLENAGRAAGIEDFGVRLAETRQLSNLGPLALVATHEPTLRRALEAIVRYMHLHNESLSLRIEDDGPLVWISFTIIIGERLPARQLIELSVGAVHRMMGSMLKAAWQPKAICFLHDAPRDRSTYRRVFGAADVQFNAAFDGILCRSVDLERPMPTGDPLLARYARAYLEEVSSAVGEEAVEERVHHLVRALLPSRTCTAARIASLLGVDRRTMHRHLHRRGSNYVDVLRGVRRELVDRHVTQSHRPLTDVAALLGFGSLSAFSDWFRDEYGCSASDWRGRAMREVVMSTTFDGKN